MYRASSRTADLDAAPLATSCADVVWWMDDRFEGFPIGVTEHLEWYVCTRF
jgi:hypothetical protein